MAYLGNSPPKPSLGPATVQVFTSLSSQVLFTISGGYTPGFIEVYQNGVRLIPTDYTATNGTTVTLAIGASLNDEVMFILYAATNMGAIVAATNSIYATNISGGTAGGIAYQTGSNTTGFSNVNGIVKSNGSGAPSAVVSGTDVKTINDVSILGSGNIIVSNDSVNQIQGVI